MDKLLIQLLINQLSDSNTDWLSNPISINRLLIKLITNSTPELNTNRWITNLIKESNMMNQLLIKWL